MSGGAVEPGKAMVITFNYDAVTGTYTFWDSRSKSSIIASLAASDFSLPDAVKLGSTNNSDRYFKGFVGEVKIYNTVLPDDTVI